MLEANSWWRQVRHRRGSEATPRQALRRVRLLRPALLVPVTAGVALALLASALLWGAPAAQAQSGLATPANFQAVNGPNAGEAILSWDAVAGADFYRVGWVAEDAVLQAFAAKSDALNHYVFADITSATSYTATGLQPGKKYWFTVASLSERFGESGRADVLSLTLNDDGSSCPSPTPGPGSTVTPTPAPQVTGGDYDADNDGLIEIRNLAQLDAIRYDLDGDGASEDNAYAVAFPDAASGMGCPSSNCTGYELAADLDFGSTVSAHGWEPIGYWNSGDDYAEFNAVFDGNDHTISNLYISRSDTDYIGLVGLTGSDSVIRRTRLASVTVTGGSNVGGLVGINNGTITASYATGTVSGTDSYVGGIAGYNNGTITDSYTTTTVSSASWATGGLVGLNTGAVTASHTTGSVTNTSTGAGGLVGFSSGTITASYATGDVTSIGHSGGLVGNSAGIITASYATGGASSTGTELRIGRSSDTFHAGDVGGLVGHSSGTITASYATGSVFSSGGYNACSLGNCPRYDGAGGLVGDNVGTINASYATGSVSSGRYTNDGGLVGQNSGIVSTSYWDIETSGLATSTGGTSATTAELQSPTGATGIYAGWNAGWWDFGTSEQYPVLKVEGLSVALQRGEAVAQSPTGPGPGAVAADRDALVALYNATGDSDWKYSVGWNTLADLDEWYGVSTNGAGRVTELVLEHNDLSGPLPAELGNLTELTRLSLGSNRITGPIPPQLGSLDKLTRLGLTNNRLTGSIPPQLGNLSNLTHLSIGNNELSGAVPRELGNLASLTKLYLSHNQLSGPIPATLGNLTNLTTLYITNNQLSGAIPSELGSLTTLTHLHLSSNRLNGEIPQELGNLANLRQLYLNDQSYFRGRTFSDLGSVANLERQLNTAGNYVHGAIPASLGQLTNLRKLDLSDNRLSGTIPSALGELPRLEVLNLSHNRLSGNMIALGSPPDLKIIDLSSNQLNGPLSVKAGQPNPDPELRVVNLSDNQLTGAIPATLGFHENYREIEALNLSNNQLNGSIPSDFSKLTNLRVLNLGGNQLSGEIPPELGSIETLVEMDLDGNPGLVHRAGQYAQNAEAIAKDRYALTQLFNATGGPEGAWANDTNWGTTAPLEEWHGVTVVDEHDPNRPGRTGRVIAVDLSDNSLAGNINNWTNTLPTNFEGTMDSPLFWLETLNMDIVSDLEVTEGNIHTLLFVSPNLSEVGITSYAQRNGQLHPEVVLEGELENVNQRVISSPDADGNIDITVDNSRDYAGTAATVVKVPITVGVWSVRVLKWSGKATAFVVRWAPAAGIIGPVNVAHTVISFGMGTEGGGCLVENFWLTLPEFLGGVTPVVGQEVAYSHCVDIIVDNMLTPVVEGLTTLVEFSFGVAERGLAATVGALVSPFRL